MSKSKNFYRTLLWHPGPILSAWGFWAPGTKVSFDLEKLKRRLIEVYHGNEVLTKENYTIEKFIDGSWVPVWPPIRKEDFEKGRKLVVKEIYGWKTEIPTAAGID